jgi:hypothetical protein
MSRGWQLFGMTALAVVATGGAALAQGLFTPAPPTQNPLCTRLESQLSAVDRGGNLDPARAEQARRYEDAVNKQQGELDRTVAQSRRLGCEGRGFFSLFTGENAQCPQLNQQIQQMRGNLDRVLSELQRIRGGGGERETQRQAIIAALAQNNCGPQYRAAANQQRGFFDSLFGGGGGFGGLPDTQTSTYRTLCVRTCDGYYFPISFATTPARFGEDEQTCHRLCPATEVRLFSHRNPGEEVTQAVSTGGQPYSELPNAFKYRQAYNPTCSCRRPGESWADALGGNDTTVEQGDIVVTDQTAKTLAQPRDAQGRPLRPADVSKQKAAPAGGSEAPAGGAAADTTKRAVRTVGPTFVPAR